MKDDVIGPSDPPVPPLAAFQRTLNFGQDILKFSAELFKQNATFSRLPSFATVLQGDRQIEDFASKEPQRGWQRV